MAAIKDAPVKPGHDEKGDVEKVERHRANAAWR